MMITLANTTYYPAILLRKRWLEAGAERGAAFDILTELERLHAAPPLSSPGVSELEQWSVERKAAAEATSHRTTNEELGMAQPAPYLLHV